MEHKIDKNFHDTRLDKYIRKKYEGINLTEIFKLIRKGRIKVNGKKVKQNYRLQDGDIVKVFYMGGETAVKKFIDLSPKETEYIKKGIVYEDEDVLLFNKSPNMVMHKGSGHDYGLSEMLKSYYQREDFTFINRIDKATSGLIIGAKNLPMTRKLSEDMRDGNINKRYYILVEGRVDREEFQIKSYLKKTDTHVVELEKYEKGAKESISYFKVVQRGKNRTILEGTLGTGRTHQLRVHLANLGHPIVGDAKYGENTRGEMCLFSHYTEILSLGIKVDLPLPEVFKNKLTK
ncbi:RluA family pseudouridine synthase [Ilyobacter polytropus]|uniref:Pseudouridine synthase n=1 Tax=Ilyobacter polytropus (strain ATCC 51220 / DSM 2926 / LMG 16218 / CuHBu1) TaxID=572544 RepID=E3HB12_ILYPC|nr:RluA family pseudouridine synthase [Ilyobacter polytropus]ADO82161.1 pseudouridine synthase [Ilyobacter polytropus DSM 2926]